MTSEQLYLAISSQEDDLDSELEELLVGTNWTDEGVGIDQGMRVATLLR
jgi:hypothetical protein